MERTKVICHMYTSIDGKIVGAGGGNDDCEYAGEVYDKQILEMANAWGCGRATMQEDIQVDLTKFQGVKVERKDKVAKDEFYFFAFDRYGKLRWKDNYNDYATHKSRIVEVLTEKVSDEFLAYLDSLNILYIFAGKETLDVPLFLKKIKELFGLETFVLCGGAMINAEFMKEDLVDEISLIVAPYIKGDRAGLTFVGTENIDSFPKYFKVKEAKVLDRNTLQLRYIK